jgi:hypothetical protein
MSNVSCIDDAALTALGDSCTQLTSLQLFDVITFTSRGLVDVLRRCTRLDTLTLHNCHGVDDACIVTIAEHCRQLTYLSLGLGSNDRLSPRAVVSLVMRCNSLTSLTFEGNSHFKVFKTVFSRHFKRKIDRKFK